MSNPRRTHFDDSLRARGLPSLTRTRVRTLQVNLGKLCNQSCRHCHVEAGPKRTEVMPESVVGRVIDLLAISPGVDTVDLTGGAPELNPAFRRLVTEARRLGRDVIDRCNLTILFEPGMEDLADFLAEQRVHIIASLPCYQKKNVEEQRGRGVFDNSIRALQVLNNRGFGGDDAPLKIDLVYNPVGASLPPDQGTLEARYREELRNLFGIEFRRLLTLTNMPIRRFADFLHRTGQSEAYMELLVNNFNPHTVPELMCRSLLSVGWDGRLHDCDFNQMLDLPLGGPHSSRPRTVWNLESLDDLVGAKIATGGHCYGCTAGAGSSCGGALQ